MYGLNTRLYGAAVLGVDNLMIIVIIMIMWKLLELVIFHWSGPQECDGKPYFCDRSQDFILNNFAL